ncbi:MAG: hypothetical protein IJD81_02650 [Oscillospiraceae bacterium]|nr:hypothetical protein [Oscillospiraceae bacterium]
MIVIIITFISKIVNISNQQGICANGIDAANPASSLCHAVEIDGVCPNKSVFEGATNSTALCHPEAQPKDLKYTVRVDSALAFEILREQVPSE